MRQLATHIELVREFQAEQYRAEHARVSRHELARLVVGSTLLALGIGGSFLLEALILDRLGVR